MNSAPRPLRNFKSATGGNYLKPKKWDEWSVDDFVEGVYEDASERDKYGNPIYMIRVEDSKITGPNPTIMTGEKKGLMPIYDNGALKYQMQDASYGDVIRLTYKGKTVTGPKSKFPGKPCHSIEVLIAEADSDALPPLPTSDEDLLG